MTTQRNSRQQKNGHVPRNAATDSTGLSAELAEQLRAIPADVFRPVILPLSTGVDLALARDIRSGLDAVRVPAQGRERPVVLTVGDEWCALHRGEVVFGDRVEGLQQALRSGLVPESLSDFLGPSGEGEGVDRLERWQRERLSPEVLRLRVEWLDRLRCDVGQLILDFNRPALNDAGGLDEKAWSVVDRLLDEALQDGLGLTSEDHTLAAALRQLASSSPTIAIEQAEGMWARWGGPGPAPTPQRLRVLLESIVRLPPFGHWARHLGFVYEQSLARHLAVGSDGWAMMETSTLKRREGIYYTPTDAVRFILGGAVEPVLDAVRGIALPGTAEAVLAAFDRLRSLRFFDPSVGGAEFLHEAIPRLAEIYRDLAGRAAKVLADRSAAMDGEALRVVVSGGTRPISLALAHNLYGFDLDPRAARYARLGLLSRASVEIAGERSAHDALREALEGHLRAEDTLKWAAPLVARCAKRTPHKQHFDDSPVPAQSEQSKEWTDHSFDLVVGNPPYRRLTEGERRHWSKQGYRSAESGDLFALFLEVMQALIRRPGQAGALVVPMSIAFSRGMASIRQVLLEPDRQSISFAHFDNIPDALFPAGKPENTNTNKANSQRATVVTLLPQAGPRSVRSSGLLRWRTSHRAQIWSRVHCSDVTGLASAADGVPKPGSEAEVRFLEVARRSGVPLGRLMSSTGHHELHVGATARYFIAATAEPQKKGGAIVFSFASRDVRDLAMAALNSNVFYWYWRVFGDGFHVTKSMVESFPLPSSWQRRYLDAAIEAARSLEEAIPHCRVSKRNAGQNVVAVNYNLRPDLLRCIDRLYADGIGYRDGGIEFLEESKATSFLEVHSARKRDPRSAVPEGVLSPLQAKGSTFPERSPVVLDIAPDATLPRRRTSRKLGADQLVLGWRSES